MSIPEYSEEANETLDIFYVGLNEVNLYFEDADQENLYEQVAKKAISGKRIVRVFTLNGCNSCLEHKDDPSNEQIRNRFYILDKDFSDFLGTQVADERVIYLDRFCIENYFLEIPAIIEFIVESMPKEKADTIKANLSLESYIEDISGAVRDLHKKFLLCQFKKLPLANTSLPPENFATAEKNWALCDDLVSSFDQKINSALLELGLPEDIDQNFSADLVSRFNEADLHCVVSGKFIMSLIFHRIKLKYKLGSITFYSFVYRVAKNCSLDPLKSKLQVISNS